MVRKMVWNQNSRKVKHRVRIYKRIIEKKSWRIDYKVSIKILDKLKQKTDWRRKLFASSSWLWKEKKWSFDIRVERYLQYW